MPAPKAIQKKCQVFRDTMRELGDMGRVVFESLSKSIYPETAAIFTDREGTK